MEDILAGAAPEFELSTDDQIETRRERERQREREIFCVSSVSGPPFPLLPPEYRN